MRNVTLTLSVAALAVAGTAVAGGRKCEQEAKIARAIAVAEVDFELHRAQLGLVGSSLLSEGRKAARAASTAPVPEPDPALTEPAAPPQAASEKLERH